MPRKKKTYGPSLDKGVTYKVVPATKAALKKLREEFKGEPRLVENMTSISAVSHVGKKEGIEAIESKAASWENTYCPYVTIQDVDALKTQKTDQLKERIKREEAALKKLVASADVTKQKAALITCKNCTSKIARGWIRESVCPVCGFSLISPTAGVRIENKKQAIRNLKAALESEKRKRRDFAPLRYLVAMPKEKEKTK